MKTFFQKNLLALALGVTLTAFAPLAHAQHTGHGTASNAGMVSKGRMAQKYRDVRGQVVSVFAPRSSERPTLKFAHESVPGFMRAMTMILPLHNSNDAKRLKSGMKFRFDLIKMEGTYHVANIRPLSRGTRLKLAR